MKTVCIIGGGPVGLNAFIKFRDKGYYVTLFEARDKLGGQITEFYPDKKIYDLKEIKPILASSYVNILISLCDKNRLFTNARVINIKPAPNYRFTVCTEKMQESCDILVFAMGLGFPVPRKLGLEGEEHCNNIFYSVQHPLDFKDKKVVIFGGGDTALDWANELSSIAQSVSLVHRRDIFRGNADTVKGNDKINIFYSYTPELLTIDNGTATSVLIKSVKDKSTTSLECDAIICSFGTIPYVDRLLFNNLKEPNFIPVNEHCETKYRHIFAIGDVATYEKKKKRIQAGIEEVDKIISYLDET